MADLGDTIINGYLCVLGNFSSTVNTIDNFCIENNLYICGCVINKDNIICWNSTGAGNHVHNDFSLLETYTNANVCITDAVNKKHAHSNFSDIENINTIKISAWDSAYTDSHAHSNKLLLDSYTQDNDDIIDSINKRHAQNTDECLSSANTISINTSGSGNIADFKNGGVLVSSVDTNGLYTGCISWGCITNKPACSTSCIDASVANSHIHSNLILLESYTCTNACISDALTKAHTHTNSTILNAIDQDVYEGADVNFDITCANHLYVNGCYVNNVLDSIGVITINESVCTCCVLRISDKGSHLIFCNVCPIQIHIPTNACVSFPLGSQIDFSQACTGQLEFCNTGITLNSRFCNRKTSGLWSGASLLKTGVDAWFLIGDLTT